MSAFRDRLINTASLVSREAVQVDHHRLSSTFEPAVVVDAVLADPEVRNLRRLLRAQSLSYSNVNHVPLDAWLLSHRCDPAVIAWVLDGES